MTEKLPSKFEATLPAPTPLLSRASWSGFIGTLGHQLLGSHSEFMGAG